MELSLKAQTVAFLITVLSGVLYGMIYDVLRIFRIAVKHKAIAVFIEDLLFFTVIAFLTFLLALAQERGEIRFYHILGETLGFVIYYLTLGEAVLLAADRIIALLRFIFRLVNRLVISPVLRLFKLIFFIPLKIFKKIFGICKKIVKKLKFMLKKRCILLYNSSIVKKKRNQQTEDKQKEDGVNEKKRNKKKRTHRNRKRSKTTSKEAA